jgi:hypothetical protein
MTINPLDFVMMIGLMIGAGWGALAMMHKDARAKTALKLWQEHHDHHDDYDDAA